LLAGIANILDEIQHNINKENKWRYISDFGFSILLFILLCSVHKYILRYSIPTAITLLKEIGIVMRDSCSARLGYWKMKKMERSEAI
jgi:hypothetical protein